MITGNCFPRRRRGWGFGLGLFVAALAISAQGTDEGTALRRLAGGPYGAAPEPASAWPSPKLGGIGPDTRESAAEKTDLGLDIDEAVSLALERNISLAAERIGVETKHRAAELAWNSFLPTVDTGVTLGRMNRAQTYSGLAPISGAPGGLYYVMPFTEDLPRWNLSASLSAQLVLNAALFESIKALRLDYEAGLVSYAQAKAQLERDVRKGFYNLLLLRENKGLMSQNIATAERRYTQAAANYKAGLAPELTMLQAQVAWENLKPSLEEMRVGYESARAAFALSLGLPRGTLVEPRGEILPRYVGLDADDFVASRIDDRLDVQALLKSLEILTTNEEATRRQLWTPSLVLGWSFDPIFQGDPWKDSLFKEDWKQSSGMLRATLSFRLNGLLPQSKEAQNLAQLRDTIERTRAGLAMTIRGAETEIDALVMRLEKSRQSAASLKLNVKLAERAYGLAEEAYKAGAKDLLDAQTAELELQKARLEVLKEDYTYVTGLLDLEYALNLPFGSLSAQGGN